MASPSGPARRDRQRQAGGCLSSFPPAISEPMTKNEGKRGTAGPEALAEEVRRGGRRALARAITLIESTRPDHRRQAADLLEALLAATGKSVRLGISGVPGVGKSTLIEAFGRHVVREGHRIAVLAVDPSSRRSGGSILGDKTRMEALAREADAFIRPSPTGGGLGGVARRTREAMLACEAAGFDVIVVETVGVGQSEVAVADMVDMFVLMLLPGAGDDLQGIKRGIIELADLILVNKADGDMKKAAGRAAADYRHALDLLRPMSPNWTPPVQLCSAREGTGIAEVWETIGRYMDTLSRTGEIAERRAGQAKVWMWSEIEDGLLAAFRDRTGMERELAAAEAKVAKGEVAPTAAAQALLALFLERR